ncbi:MAG TPA: DUF3857 domain-containing protein [Xanthomonadaceae bacterium]
MIDRNDRGLPPRRFAAQQFAEQPFASLAFIACCLLALLLPLPSFAAEYAVGPAPAWVEHVRPGEPSKEQLAHVSDGVAYLLIDSQVRTATPGFKDRYRHFIKKALNAKGVESIANLEIQFDPSYQTLTLHSIDIVRNGRTIAKLPAASVKILQRETELDSLIYDGSKTANIFLDDVRSGDVVDYAYTVSGRNRVFGDRDFGNAFLQYDEPSARIHARLLIPSQEPLTLASRNGAQAATIREHDGLRDYEWDATDTTPATVDKGAPDWYFPYAQVEWSQFPNWAAVAHWALPLYKVPDRIGPDLQREVDRIARAQSGETGRALAALRLVQGDVRYLGIEIGANSHAPNPPDTVFGRRFGDCKDKTLLTLTLLDRLGIKARAALVDTQTERGIADVLPNPAAFDHVIVQARLNGAWYWLDPTRPAQLSDLAHIYQPDFGLALLVDPATKSLVPMKSAQAAVSSRSVQVVLDAHAGFDKPVRYSIVTTYEGGEAEDERDQFASTTLGDMQKKYLNYYADSYPGISVEKSLEMNDDKVANRLVTTEHYLIGHIDSKDAKGGHTVAIATPDIDGLLQDPEVIVRKSPLQRRFPLDVHESTRMLLPESWPDKSEDQTVSNPAFRFERRVESHGLTVAIDDHFAALADEVSVPDMPRFLADLAHGRNQLGYQLTWTGPLASATPATTATATASRTAQGIDRVNWPVSLLGMACLGIFVWLGVLVYRYDPLPHAIPSDAPRGLGGWMILVVIGLLLTLFVQGRMVLSALDAMAPDAWAKLTTFGSSVYKPAWAPSLLGELIGNIALFVWTVLLLVLMFRRRRSFPRLAAGFYVAAIAYMACDVWSASRFLDLPFNHEDQVTLSKAIVHAVIWAPYLLVSRRVKATFVNGWQGRGPAGPVSAVVGA